MIFLAFFLIGFILIIFGRAIGHVLARALTSLVRTVVKEIIRRIDLQRARLQILDNIAGTTPAPPRPTPTIEQIAADQLARKASRKERNHPNYEPFV